MITINLRSLGGFCDYGLLTLYWTLTRNQKNNDDCCENKAEIRHPFYPVFSLFWGGREITILEDRRKNEVYKSNSLLKQTIPGHVDGGSRQSGPCCC